MEDVILTHVRISESADGQALYLTFEELGDEEEATFIRVDDSNPYVQALHDELKKRQAAR